MHNHTKQQLDKIDGLSPKLEVIDDNQKDVAENIKVILEMFWEKQKPQIEAFLKQALLSQAEMIRAEMVPEERIFNHKYATPSQKANGRKNGFNHCRKRTIKNLDELINSFE